MEDKLVSVIVPVYNVEKYLVRCIESILKQTYQNFELILVNDGSCDASGKICDEFALYDERVRVIHKPNGGVSSARNRGLDSATGEYVMFVDSDDWILNEHLESLLPTSDEDMVCGGMAFYNGQECVEIKRCAPRTIVSNEWLADFGVFWAKNTIWSLWRSCYKRELIEKNIIRFDMQLDVGEDEHFNLRYIRHCNKIRFADNYTYCYNVGDHSSAMKRYHPTRLLSVIAICKAIEEIANSNEYETRWYQWHSAIAHYEKWYKRADVRKKRQIGLRLRDCFNEPYFRETLSFMRNKGSLDEKIETYFMRSYLHWLYQPIWKCLDALSKVKQGLLHK